MITMPLDARHGVRVVLLSGTKIAMPRSLSRSLRVGPSFHISFRSIDINFSQRHKTQKLQLGIYVPVICNRCPHPPFPPCSAGELTD